MTRLFDILVISDKQLAIVRVFCPKNTLDGVIQLRITVVFGRAEKKLGSAKVFRCAKLRNMQTFKPSIVIVCAVVCATIFALLPVTDSMGREHVDASFKRALAAAAIARGLNGVISVAQGTELGIQPAGIGVNFTPGEILDPINDLVERFSWIMLLASSSLGVQKVLLSMSAWNGLLLGLVVVALLLVASHFFMQSERARAVLARLFLFLLLLRFMMPLIAIANEMVYRTFLKTDYVQSSAELKSARDAIGDINNEVNSNTNAPSGFIDRASELYKQVVEKVDFEKRYERYSAAAGSIGENTVNMIVVFVMQTLVFPLLFLAILFGVLKRLTHWR